VVVNYAGNRPSTSSCRRFKAAAGQGIAVQADVANGEDVSGFSKSRWMLSAPDVVVTVQASCRSFRLPAETWPPSTRVIATNLRGTFLVFAQAAQHVS